MKRVLLAIITLLLGAGCGYKPSVYYARQVVGDSIYAKVAMLRSDPQNTVLIKDAINDAVIAKFQSHLTDEASASTKLYIGVTSVSLNAVQYDANGYVVMYRMAIVISTRVVTKDGEQKSFSTSGSYDFSVDPNTTVSESARFNAIKNSAAKAIDMLVSQISILGLIHGTGVNSGSGN